MKMNDYDMSMRWSNRAMYTGQYTRDICPKEAQKSTDYGGNENEKDESWAFLEKEN